MNTSQTMFSASKNLLFILICCLLPWAGYAESGSKTDVGKYSDSTRILEALSKPVHYATVDIDSLVLELSKIYAESVKLNYWYGQMQSSSLLGYYYGVAMSDELSMLCNKRALSITNQHRNLHIYLGSTYLSIAVCYQRQQENQRAIVWLDRALKKAQSLKGNIYDDKTYNQYVSAIYSVYALSYYYMGKLDLCNTYIRKAWQHVDRRDWDRQITIKLVEFNKNLDEKNYLKCEKLLSECISLARKADGNDERKINYYEMYSALYIKTRNYKRVYPYAEGLLKHYTSPMFAKKR